MPGTSNTDEFQSILHPVWYNTYWVREALELYEGVSTHTDELEKYKYFFGLIQKISLEYAILVLCKLFDKSNTRYKKDTVYSYLITWNRT
jgi:hypothetical protein